MNRGSYFSLDYNLESKSNIVSEIRTHILRSRSPGYSAFRHEYSSDMIIIYPAQYKVKVIKLSDKGRTQ